MSSAPLIVKHGRLMAAERSYRLALDELSNQLERLTTLSDEELDAAVEKVSPSKFAESHLPQPEIRAEVARVDFGRKITLRLAWDEPQRREAPVTLTAWRVAAP
jgi:hypothetical protein